MGQSWMLKRGRVLLKRASESSKLAGSITSFSIHSTTVLARQQLSSVPVDFRLAHLFSIETLYDCAHSFRLVYWWIEKVCHSDNGSRFAKFSGLCEGRPRGSRLHRRD